MEHIWNGAIIRGELRVKNINILECEKSIIIIPDMTTKNDYLNFFLILKFFFERTEKKNSVFGIFLDKILAVVKRKTKQVFYENFTQEKLLSILDGENKEAYYSNNYSTEKLIGIEIRYESDIMRWFDKEGIFGEINLFLIKEKKKIINEV